MALDKLQSRYQKFVAERDWEQFHTPQNLAMAISVESNELLENFLWFEDPSGTDVQQDEELVDAVREEMADVMIYLLGLAYQLDIDLLDAVEQKMAENEQRFDEETVTEFNEYFEQWQSSGQQ
jgi:NTP pyrophosphatase (non-canonical NTP hydrolase)